MKAKISLNQFYVLMFISNILFVSFITSDALSNNFYDSIVSASLNFVLGALLCIPIFMLCKQPNKFVAVFYGFYFIASDIIILTQVLKIFSNTIYYNVSSLVLVLAVLLISFYGYKKGIEAVSRTAFFVLIIFIASALFLFLGLTSLFKADNSEVLFYKNYSDSIKNTWIIFALSSYLPQTVMLTKYLNKKLDYKFFIWQAISAFVIILVLLAIVFALGRFAFTQMYPFYSLFSVAVLEPIQRMDNIFSLITLLFLSIRISVDLILIGDCFEVLVQKRKKILLPIIASLIIAFSSYFFAENNLVHHISNLTLFMPIAIIVLGFIIPLFELIKNKKMPTKLTSLLLCATICFSFAGCSTRLSDYMIIKGIGIDYQAGSYNLTVRYVDTNTETSEKNYSVKGETVYQALNQISLSSGKIPLYSASDYLIYSQEIAEKGLDEALDFFVRYFKAKANISLYICSGKASDMLELKKDDKLISSDYILESTQNKDNKGKTVSTSVLDFISYMENESQSVLVPYLFSQKEEIFATKSAAFDDYKLVNIMNEQETTAFLAAKGNLANVSEVIKLDSGELVTVEISKTDSSFKADDKDNKLKFRLCVKVKSALASMPVTLKDLSYDELVGKLERKMETQIKECLSADNLLQADFFGIGNYIYRTQPKTWQSYNKNIKNFLNDDLINIDVKIDFIKTGEEDNPFFGH